MPRRTDVRLRLLSVLLALVGLVCIAQQPSPVRGQIGVLGCGQTNGKALLYQPCASSAASCASALTGVVLNLDASIASSIHLSGSSVTELDDQSGNGNNFVQATGARQPTYSATGFNTTHPGITMVTANSQFLRNTTFPFNSATLSLFVVHNITGSDPVNDGLASFVGAGQVDDFQNAPSFLISGAGPGSFAPLVESNSLIMQSFTFSTSPKTYGVVFDGVNGTEYLNFTAGATAAHTAVFGATTADFTFGARPWNSPAFQGVDGTYAEIIMTNTAASSGQRSTLHTCLSAKWGVP